MSNVLIVIDAQNDYISGSLGTEESRNCVPEICKLIKEAKENNDFIIFTRDTHFENYLETQEGKNLPIKHCLFSSDGWQICDEIIEALGNYTEYSFVDKKSFGYPYWQEKILNKYENIKLCGMFSSACVISNALILKAMYPEILIKFYTKASSSLTVENQFDAIKTMRECQIEIVD